MGRAGYMPSLLCAEFAMCRVVPQSARKRMGQGPCTTLKSAEVCREKKKTRMQNE